MTELDEFEINVLLDFLGANWTEFISHCEERGSTADEIYNKIRGEMK
jgi:hypothetical protein